MSEITRLVDTSILIDFLRGNETALSWLNGFLPGELTISIITAAELLAGCHNRKEQKAIEKELARFPIIWVSGMESSYAWDWYRHYHLSHGSGFLDCLIAASAQQSNLIVCTLNDKHFRHLPGVQVERPY